MTTEYTAPDHLLRLDEWDALPVDTSRRLELVEGVLLVSPRPQFRHQDTVVTLVAALRGALPPAWRALVDVEILVDDGPPPTVRVPDVVVVPAALVDGRARCRASQVLAAFEVLSPGTMRTDRVTKMSEYAEAGIDVYGLVDPGPPPTVTQFRLGPGGYEPGAGPVGRLRLDLDTEVVEIRLDL